MPEGNTIHWLARRHNRDYAGKRVRVSSPQGRFEKEANRLDRRVFLEAEAYGKHLFHHWRHGLIVHVHLGMAGWFYRHTGDPPAPRPSVRMRLSAPGVTTDLIGPPACEIVTEAKRDEILARLGPDPLRGDFDPERVWKNLRRRSRPIGDALLDQKVMAGVGNIYRNEALFLAGIRPLRRTARVRREEWERLWRILRDLMRRGAAGGRIVTIEPGEKPHPFAARVAGDDFYVYQQSRCRRCGGPLREMTVSARRMFACSRCQV
jgi:endonuclease-8